MGDPHFPNGFHSGEIQVQQQAGVRADAARLEGMLDKPQLSDGISRFLAARTYLALSTRDRSGRLWVSRLLGPWGFISVSGPAEVTIAAAPRIGDPLHGLPDSQPVGLLVIDYAIRRRFRINGTLRATTPASLTVEVTEAFGNCPQYIPTHPSPRSLRDDAASPTSGKAPAERSRLDGSDISLIQHANTFVLGTIHPTRGADASHRGGPDGFVQIDRSISDGKEHDILTWPDYPGNNMFNSLGNLAVDPTAALFFANFDTGQTLHLSGAANTIWNKPSETHTGRRITFRVDQAVHGLPDQDWN